jgi:hypothetical protein
MASKEEQSQPENNCANLIDERSREQYRAMLGKAYAVEFLNMLAENLEFVIDGWLLANGAPDEIRSMMQNAFMLERIVPEKRHGQLSNIDAEYLAEEIPGITEKIMKYGGRFDGPWTEGMEREQINKSGNPKDEQAQNLK